MKEKLIKNSRFINDEEFMDIIKSELEDYNIFCWENGMKECKLSINELYVKNIMKLGYACEEYFQIYMVDSDERTLCVVSFNIFNTIWKKVL